MNTVDPDFFQKNIPEAYRLRKNLDNERKQKNFEITNFMFNLISQSNQVCKGKWKALIGIHCVYRFEG